MAKKKEENIRKTPFYMRYLKILDLVVYLALFILVIYQFFFNEIGNITIWWVSLIFFISLILIVAILFLRMTKKDTYDEETKRWFMIYARLFFIALILIVICLILRLIGII
jgi:small-conductance mechanosensitive channel